MSSPASRPVPPAAASLLNLRGAVDLSSLKQRQAPPGAAGNPPAPAGPGAANGAAPNGTAAAGAADAGTAPLRVNVTEGNFQELVELSAQVPVVFALWAA